AGSASGAHANLMTLPGTSTAAPVESCATCHGAGRDNDASKVHVARP
ncbi:MAG: hypothetical protein HYV09_28605, partial [Deltaproteobacteria bacterium]|nr:hypothetical protein [Deltaproteobacteria bacterium]